ncbi:MAG: cysteine desulfurase family protein [Hyphomicrobiales bacterium]|nr:cysteine desulfurase family protein [Hyphomicrobiales bacterium]
MTSPLRSYLDWNATAPVRPEVMDAVTRALGLAGNPSSVHAEGRAAHAAVERAREQVAALVNAPASRVVFTSGGSEANVFALTPSLTLNDRRPTTHLLMSATEHPCVRDGHRFSKADAIEIPVTADGLIALDRLAEALAEPRDGRALVSVHMANNETGAIQPIAQIGLMCREHDALLHVDAVQAAGKIGIDMTTLGADVLTLSAHKLGGPKGVGAVIFGSDRIEVRDRLIRGGGQEKGARAGTENVAGNAGFGAAAELALAELEAEAPRQRAMRDWFETELRAKLPATTIFAADAPRLPNTSCFATPGVRAENALISIDLAGVSVSSGSACSSGKVRPSHVLQAMGVSPSLAGAALRVSLGRLTVEADLKRFLAAYAKHVSVVNFQKAEAAG